MVLKIRVFVGLMALALLLVMVININHSKSKIKSIEHTLDSIDDSLNLIENKLIKDRL